MRNAFHMKVVFLAALAAAVGSTAVAANNRPGTPERIADIPMNLEPEGPFNSKASIPREALIVRRADEGTNNGGPAALLPSAQSIARLDYTFVTGEAVGDNASDNLFRPAISGNGQFIAYTSFAQNLVAEDTLGIAQVYRTDISTPAGTNLLVSKTAGGTGGNGGSGAPTFIFPDPMVFDFWANSISDDGTKVCFTSEAEDLQTAVTDSNSNPDVFVWNFNGGTPTITMVSTDSTGAQMANSPVDVPLNYSRDGMISGNGNFVAFLSTGTLPGTGSVRPLLTDINISLDLFRKDLTAGTTILISSNAAAPADEANGDSYDPSISQDGTVIAYTSHGRNQVNPPAPTAAADGFGERTDIFVWNAGTTTVANRTTTGTIGTAANQAFTARLSPNGRFVAFNSRLAPAGMGTGTIGAIAAGRHAYVRDLTGGDAAIRYVNTATGSHLDPGLTRLMAPTPNNNGDVFFWGYGDIFLPATGLGSRQNNHATVWVKKFTNAWPATDFAGTVTLVSKSETNVGPNAGYGHFANGFTGGRPDFIGVSGDGTKALFTSTSLFGKGGAGIRNAWVATLDANYNVTNLERYPKAIAKPGITVNFSGPTGMRIRDSKRVAISPNGRYAGLVVCSTGVLDKDTPPGINVQRRYNSAAEGEAYRVDLNNRQIGYASFENDGTTITPIEVQGTATSLGVTGASPGDGTASIFPSGSPFNCSGVAVSNFGDVAFISQHSFEAGGAVVAGGQYVYVTNPTTAESDLLTDSSGNFFTDSPTATYFYGTVETFLSSDGRYVGFTHDSATLVPDSTGEAWGYIYDRANADNATKMRLVTRRSNVSGGFVAQDLPNAQCVLVAMSNDGQKAIFHSTDADDVLLGGPTTNGQLFLYNDMADGIPNNGEGGGATITLVSCDSTGAPAASATIDGLAFSTGFGTTSSIDLNASVLYFPGVIDSTIPNSPAGLSAGIPGSQLYAKSLVGSVNPTTTGIQSSLSCLSRKTDNSFLTALTVGGGLITNPDTFEEIDSATVSADGGTLVVVTNARSSASVGLPGSLGQDANSPVGPTGGTSNYDVFVVENALSSPTWTVASRATNGDQMSFGPENFVQLQTPAAHNPGIGVTSNGRIRIVFGTEGDDFVGNGDSAFGRCIYVREYFTASPSAVTAPWSSYE